MIRSRNSASSHGLGAISISFWCRRCTLQSRSHRCAIPPLASPRICTSMCRARSTSRSAYTPPSPNAARASDWQRSYASAIRSASRTTRMPRPPPPAAALMAIGAPPSDPKNARTSSSDAGPPMPGSTGTSCSTANARAAALSPNSASVSAPGPMNVIPASAHARANAACSLRKP